MTHPMPLPAIPVGFDLEAMPVALRTAIVDAVCCPCRQGAVTR